MDYELEFIDMLRDFLQGQGIPCDLRVSELGRPGTPERHQRIISRISLNDPPDARWRKKGLTPFLLVDEVDYRITLYYTGDYSQRPLLCVEDDVWRTGGFGITKREYWLSEPDCLDRLAADLREWLRIKREATLAINGLWSLG